MYVDLLAARRCLWGVTVLSYVSVLLTAELVGMPINYVQISYFAGYFFAATVVLSFCFGLMKVLLLRAAVETLGCGFLLTVPVVISTYLAIHAKLPLADDILSSWDLAIGFHWHEFVTYIDQRPIMAGMLSFAYQSFSFQLLLLPILLIVCGHQVRAYRMLIAYALICFVASIVSIWFPALGTYTVYNVTPGDMQNINTHFGYFFLEQFHAVRDNPDFVFNLSDAAGILTFPSVHAGVAALCAWGAWSFRRARYPMLFLNVLMALAAVSHANHYMVDVIAGVASAAVCIYVTCRLTIAQQKRELAQSPLAAAA